MQFTGKINEKIHSQNKHTSSEFICCRLSKLSLVNDPVSKLFTLINSQRQLALFWGCLKMLGEGGENLPFEPMLVKGRNFTKK